jgi:prepilin-type N-terminal cleavage/methylation domain-containing protein/prepilin-type processing-associated H-X9-DG protein
MKKKGFTLVELLVVIAIIALLMGILMPALARVRAVAYRMVCGSNLSGIGKAMLIYANDYEDELPRAGGRESILASPVIWAANDRYTAYGMPGGVGGKATITSCHYLLVKFAEVTPKSFVCKSDTYTSEFKPSTYNSTRELIDLWDFGPTTAGSSQWPMKHCSYAYHQPLPCVVGAYAYALTTSSEPGMAVAADRSPWVAPPVTGGLAKSPTGPPAFNPTGTPEEQKVGNSLAHQEDGQNALFLDGHVYFEKRAFCGIDDDNIYTFWAGTAVPYEKRRGVLPLPTANSANFSPRGRTDTFLVNDPTGTGKVVCFPADALVWVDGSLMQISKVAAGQTAGRLNCLAAACVEQIETVQEHEGIYECRDIVLENGNCIGVVDTHLFLLDSGQWVAAQNLRSGLKLQCASGPIGIKHAIKRAMPVVGKVYNLKIKGSEKYFVGKDAAIVRDY